MTLQRGGNWRVGHIGIVRTWTFVSRGCGSRLVSFWEAVLPDPQLRADPMCALLHCSPFLLYWFCRARVCHLSVPTWSLCPLTVVPLSDPFHPAWPSQWGHGRPVGPRLFPEHLCSPFPLRLSEFCRLPGIPYPPSLFTRTLHPLAW